MRMPRVSPSDDFPAEGGSLIRSGPIRVSAANLTAPKPERRSSPRSSPMGSLDLPTDTLHRTVKTRDGGKIHLVERGEGPPLLLLHGVLLSVATWPYQLRELSQDHRVIVMDQRGHGLSTAGQKGYSLDVLGDDVLTVLRSLKLKNAVIVGHSMGGMVTLNLAARRLRDLSNHCSGMVLVATTGDPIVSFPGFRSVVKVSSPMARLAMSVVAGKNPLGSRGPLSYLSTRVILGNSPSDDNVDFARALISAASPKLLSELWAELLSFDVRDSLPEMDIPSLVVVGDRDLMIAPWHGLRMVRSMPNAEYKKLSDCGHMVMFERHQELNKLIRAFAKEHQPRNG